MDNATVASMQGTDVYKRQRVHHGGALAVHILDAFEDGVAALRVHGHGRLVEEDELGLVRDAACDVQATQQAAREFPRAELLVVLQADERDGLVNKVAALRARCV